MSELFSNQKPRYLVICLDEKQYFPGTNEVNKIIFSAVFLSK